VTFFSDLLKNEDAPLDAAKELAPYGHPKLTSIEAKSGGMGHEEWLEKSTWSLVFYLPLRVRTSPRLPRWMRSLRQKYSKPCALMLMGDDTLMGMTPPEWFDHDERRWLPELKVSGSLRPFEKEYFRKDGSRVPVLIGAATFEEGGDQGVAFVLDLTERKRTARSQRVNGTADNPVIISSTIPSARYSWSGSLPDAGSAACTKLVDVYPALFLARTDHPGV